MLGTRKRLSLGLATLCLVLSLLSVAQEVIVDYNKAVHSEQFDKQTMANHGTTFNVDVWGIDYAKRDRHLIFLLCVFGFFLSLSTRTIWFSLVTHGLTLLTVYHWIDMNARALTGAPGYMADSPYLLRIASPFDWALFVSLIITFGVKMFLLLRRRG